jgi:peptidoglycan hydrolase CwlO-like protein
MKKTILALVVLTLVITSCSRSVSPSEAASKGYKRCHAVK